MVTGHLEGMTRSTVTVPDHIITQHGAASLLDFLDAQADCRVVQLNYLNLVGSYLEAANQLNLAAGHEVVP
jgi:protein involved in temperature-dependent protein secretion